jgi:putative acetyltransferase
MRRRRDIEAGAPAMAVRAGWFGDVPEILRLIERAIEHGCRQHYDAEQRRAVYAGYATTLFADAVGPFQTLVVEIHGRLAAVAQLDPAGGVLRALFVDGALQGQGVGRALLAAVEARARAAGCRSLGGAMSLNAVPFYTSAGFRPQPGVDRLRTSALPVPVVRMVKPIGS